MKHFDLTGNPTGVSTFVSRTSPSTDQSLQKSFHLSRPDKLELKKISSPSENKKYATTQPNDRQKPVARQTPKPLTVKRLNYSVDRRPACNSGFAKKRVQWLIEHSTSHQILWYVDSLVLRNPLLRKSANRYVPFKTTVMKTVLILTILYLNVTYCFSQKQFTINSSIVAMTIKINGIQYQADSIGTKIKTNYPKFDTLVFLGDAPNINRPIICNFKPDTAYTISVACCGSLDIIPASKFKNDSLSIWDYEKDFDKIQNQLIDRPFISIRTKRNPKDTIYSWHADAACMTEHKTINSSLWRLGIPPKCFYWNNITTIQFFKTDEKMGKHEETDLEEFLQIKSIVELSSISFRLFDNERFVITFDEKNNSINLEYE